MYKYIILITIVFVFYFLLTKTKESFTNFESMQEKDIMPIYKNVTPRQMVDFFGGIDQLAAILVANDVPVKYLTDPTQYPKIASYLKLKLE
jgi:hypothetical protein